MPQLNVRERYDHGTFTSRIQLKLHTQVQWGQEMNQRFQSWFKQQSKWKQWLIIVIFIIMVILLILMIVFHSYLIEKLIELSDSWKQFSLGKLILFILVFFVGFPPLIGYSTLSLFIGMVYGFPDGWPLLASATVAGSFASFLVFRYILHERAENLMNSNENFKAFSEILDEKNSLFLLVLIRLCPLPYSLSNGALAAIPTLSPTTFLLSQVITSPKVLIHLFVGYKLKSLGDGKESKSTKIIDIVGILITLLAATITTSIIYYKMQQKLTSYHSANNLDNQDYDQMIFGNFDDLESGNIELNSQEFDADHFIIDDDDIANNSTNKINNDNSTDVHSLDFEINSDDDINVSSNNRDY